MRIRTVVPERTPSDLMALGRRRTSGFIDLWVVQQKVASDPHLQTMTLGDLLASAYIQGVRDMAETVINKQKRGG